MLTIKGSVGSLCIDMACIKKFKKRDTIHKQPIPVSREMCAHPNFHVLKCLKSLVGDFNPFAHDFELKLSHLGLELLQLCINS